METITSLLNRIESLEIEILELKAQMGMLQESQVNCEKNIVSLSTVIGKLTTKPRKTQYQLRSERLQQERYQGL